MRTKQCAIRRLANDNSEDDDETTAAGSPLHSPAESGSRPQTQLSVLATTINGQGQQQLEDGTIVVQPEAAEATDGNQTGCFDHAASVARCTAPGIYDTVKCTACGKRVNPYNGTMEVHPLLKVLVCHKCYKFYETGHFDADEDGKENQCRWCGEGGSLICCDNCEHSFCRTCIKRNLGRSALQDIEGLPDESVWLCYACDQGALRNLQEEANIVVKAVRDHFKEASKRSEKQKVSQAKKAGTTLLQQQKQHNLILIAPSHGHQQQHRPAGVPVQANPSPAIAAYGSLRGGGVTTTIGGIHLDLSAVPKVSAAAAAAVPAPRLPNQQSPLQPHRLQPHQNNNPLAQQQHHQLQQAGAVSVTQRTEQWYKQNVRIETILADIESVDTRNIGTALNATVSLLQGMMRQYSRFMQDLTMANTQADKGQIVSRFKSAYRMHLFLRLGKLRSLIAEEDKHLMRKSAAAAVASGRSSFIDLTGPTPSAAGARPVQSGLLLPLQARVAANPQQQRPQPQVSQVSSVSAAAQAKRLPPVRQRPDRASTGASATPSAQQPPLPPPPPELIVVLSDDEDNNDDENNNNNGGSENGEGNVAADDGRDQRAASAHAVADSESASVSPSVSTVAATATANGGKPAAILELLEARRRREKCARKPQLPRRLAAATCSADDDGEDSNSADAAAEETASSTAAPLSEPERPASTSSSSSLSASGSGSKRHALEVDGAESGEAGGGPPREKRLRESEAIAAPPEVDQPESASAEDDAQSPSNASLPKSGAQVAATVATT